jgi:hypothetical protein
MKDRWIHEDDVRHRDEGGEAGQNFGAPVRAKPLEFEVPLEAPERRSGGHDDERIVAVAIFGFV